MIVHLLDGWHFITDAHGFGPYAEKSGAEACRTQYEAFIESAPQYHHGASQ